MLLLVGCSDSSETATGTPDSQSEETTADDDGTAGDADTAAEEPVAGGAEEEVLHRLAAASANLTTYSFTSTISQGTESLVTEGQIDHTTDPPNVASTVALGDMGTFETRMIDGVTYVNMGEAAGGWTQMDPAALGTDLGASSDPMAAVRQLEEHLLSAERVGTEDVRGAQADHYRVTVDGTFAAIEAEDAPAPPESLTYDLWFAGDHLVQMRYSFDVDGETVEAEMEMFDHGQPVQIEVPDLG